MTVLNDYETPGCVCVRCGKQVDAALETQAGGPRPKPGDISICFYCAHVAAYGPDLTLVDISDGERARVMQNPQVVNAIAAVLAVNLDRGEPS